MSFLFSAPKAPTPQPLPSGPTSTEAEAQRLAAERAAVAESKAAGRRSTIVGGMAVEDQGLLTTKSAKQREASRSLSGQR